MVRETLKSKQIEIDIAINQIQQLDKELDNKSDIITGQRSTIVKKDAEILKLQRHVRFVHAQRDRLVGFIEGRESITSPELEVSTDHYAISQPSKINRFERFVGECTLQFIDSNGPTVKSDEFRSRY